MDTTRYRAAVERNLAEVQRSLLNLKLMLAIEKAGGISGNEMKGIYHALFNDYLAHCMKVFERRGDAASFWYVYRTNQRPLDEFAKANQIDIAVLEKISDKLKHARDKTHFHIDWIGVLDPKVVWCEADINGKGLADAVNCVWALLNVASAHLGMVPMGRLEINETVITVATRMIEDGR